ncbi:hypothetical protein FNV43_RR21158 [Rhamnella rubrinervis]|uniref:Bet v I/Major latex protein domain-containing protein n=1 Tax=Rhamnella rubrinervis TaxID=2594499 RepID=A0A8K0E2K7_9ROSA|nr:hypothetical protein FNV43_RR21156 [Rhamnella rubrinervis]KAF3438396.1 hypothetical protein FNV43_RR21158 [Rhamnella rubrinervis]
MGVFTYEFDHPTKIAPEKLFNGLVVHSDKVFPKAYPQVYKKLENVSGNGGAGTIKKAHLAGGQQVNHIEVLDKNKLEFGFTVVEGHHVLKGGVEKIYNHIKIVEGPHGGSVIKSTAKYFTEDGIEFKEDSAIASREKYTGLYNAVENYLLENPHLY